MWSTTDHDVSFLIVYVYQIYVLAGDTQWQEYFQDKTHSDTYNLIILVNSFGW